MLHDENIKAALTADAELARVPADEILARVKQSGARVRKAPSPLRARLMWVAEGLVACAVVGVLFASPLLKGKQTPPEQAPASAVSATPAEKDAPAGEYLNYESKSQGFRIAFPRPFTGPELDEQGNLMFRSDSMEVAIRRQDRPAEKGVEELMGDLVTANFKQSWRLKPIDMGLQTAASRSAAFLRVSYVSAAGHFERATWAIPAGKYAYVVSCRTTVGSPMTWEQLQPTCQQIMDHLEVGTNLGYLTRAQAEEIVRKAIPGDYNIGLANIVEQMEIQGAGLVPVWRFELVDKTSGEVAYSIMLDAKSGKVYSIDNLITGEHKANP